MVSLQQCGDFEKVETSDSLRDLITFLSYVVSLLTILDVFLKEFRTMEGCRVSCY
jgi:hypothetical protein